MTDTPHCLIPHQPEVADRLAITSRCQLDLLENRDGNQPRQSTSLHAGWNESALFLSFDCQDAHLRATCTERDGPLWKEDVVEVFLDPAGDGLAYYEIELNPLNTVCDLLLRQNRSGWRKDFRWNCEGLKHEVVRHEKGWRASLRIPFLSIAPAAPRPGDQWRANFCRIDYSAEGSERELSAWAPTWDATFHRIERFGRIEFAQGTGA